MVGGISTLQQALQTPILESGRDGYNVWRWPYWLRPARVGFASANKRMSVNASQHQCRQLLPYCMAKKRKSAIESGADVIDATVVDDAAVALVRSWLLSGRAEVFGRWGACYGNCLYLQSYMRRGFRTKELVTFQTKQGILGPRTCARTSPKHNPSKDHLRSDHIDMDRCR